MRTEKINIMPNIFYREYIFENLMKLTELGW